MIERVKWNIACFLAGKAEMYTGRGDFKNIMKGLKLLKLSTYFIDEQTHTWLSEEITSLLEEES